MARYRRPRREFIWLHGYDGAQTMVLGRGITEFAIEERFAQSETLYLTIRADDQKAAYLAEDLEVRWRDRVFYIVDMVKRRDGSAGLIDIEAPALWERLGEDIRVGSLNIVGFTVLQGLEAILETSTWTVGILDPAISGSPDLYAMESTDASVLNLLRKWAKITGLELAFDTTSRTVTLATQVGTVRGIGFRYGSNVTQVERRSAPPVCTRLFPFGRDDLNISGQNAGVPYIEDFSFYTAQGLTLPEAEARYLREQVWRDSSFVSDVDLLAAATDRLALLAQPTITYTMSVIDLAELTGLPADEFVVGDTVRVRDADLGFDISTRVVRRKQRPKEPARSEIELSYLPLVVPDPDVGAGRSGTTEEWVLFEARTTTERHVRLGSSVLGRLDLSTIAGAEWVVGYSIIGTAVGAGNLTIHATDDLDSVDLFPPMVVPFTNGQQLREAFTFGEKDIDAGVHELVVRVHSDGAATGIDTVANGSAFWVLAKGTVQQSITPPNSIRYDYTGFVQTFTVPDDTYLIDVEVHGAAGGDDIAGTTTPSGRGTKVAARIPVTPGTVYDIYIGGRPAPTPATHLPGWPNGGIPVDTGPHTGYGGGGSSHIVPTGLAPTSAIIVAGAGGGAGDGNNIGAPTKVFGADSGFYAGLTGGGNRDAFSTQPGGSGATQTAGGAGSTAGSSVGTAGTAMQGGSGAAGGSFLSGGGGGGGGWFGGGGSCGGTASGGGGGGGSSWIDPASDAFDIDFTDAENTGHGFIIISWDDPTPL